MGSHYLAPRLGGRVSLEAPPTVGVLAAGLLIAGLLVLTYVSTCGYPVIGDETEGQYAGGAREMRAAGEWLVPTNDGIPRLQKPPVLYWAILVSYAMFGVNEFAARLPNAVATLGWFLAVGLVGNELGGPRLGLRAAFLLGTTFGTFIFTHIIMPEPLLALSVTATFWCFLKGIRHQERASLWMLAAWVAMAGGSLSKGLHGAAWPLLTAALAAWWLPITRPAFRRLIWGAGPLVFLLILTPWYAAMESRFPGFLGDHFINEQVGHVSDNRWPPDSDRAPLVPFLLQHAALWIPWALFVPAAVAGWWNGHSSSLLRKAAGFRLLWIGAGVIWCTVLFSARQDYYTMVSWGLLAVLLAHALEHFGAAAAWWRILPGITLAVLGFSLIAGAFFLWYAAADEPAWAAPVAQRENIWNAVRGFSAGQWANLSGPMLASGFALLGAGLLAGVFGGRRRIEHAVASTGAAMLLVFAMATRGLVEFQDYFSLARIAETLRERALPESLIVCEGEPHLAASLFFYWPRPVHWVGASPDIEFASRVHGIHADRFLSREEFLRQWRYGRSVYFIVESDQLSGEWRRLLGLDGKSPVARSGTRVLLWNGSAY